MAQSAGHEYDPKAFPPFAVTVDVVIFTICDGSLQMVLIKRNESPFAGTWALPGGFVLPHEGLTDAAHRELLEETGIESDPTHLAQLHTYGQPDRDPRMRVVTVAWWAIIPNLVPPIAGTDAADAELVEVDDVTSGLIELAFDHQEIVIDALEAARSEIEISAVATSFLADQFSISELRRVYQIIWGMNLEPGNFQRKIRKLGDAIEPTGDTSAGTSTGRPAELWRCVDPTARLTIPFRRPSRR